MLLDLPLEFEGEIYCHCPLNIKAKLHAAGNCSLKQKVKKKHTSEFYPQSLKKKTTTSQQMPSNNNSVLFYRLLAAKDSFISLQFLCCCLHVLLIMTKVNFSQLSGLVVIFLTPQAVIIVLNSRLWNQRKVTQFSFFRDYPY